MESAKVTKIRYVVIFKLSSVFGKFNIDITNDFICQGRFIAQILNFLNANSIKWSDTLKQFVGKLRTNCLSVLDHFVVLVLSVNFDQ